jgi:predicted permease
MLDPVLPIALYLTFGYLFKFFFKDNSKELIEFIIYFSLPGIVISKIYPLALSYDTLELVFMFNTIILINLVLAYALGKALRLERKILATFMIIATFGNTSFIGFSYIGAFYGTQYIIYPLIYDLFGSFLLLVSIGMIIINWGAGQTVNFKQIIRSTFLFPPMIVFFITLFLKFFSIPVFVLNTADTLGNTLVPLAMVAIGMKLQLKYIFYKFDITLVAMILKMIIVPIGVLFAFEYFYTLDDTWSKVTILEAAMPPMTMAVVLAIKGGLDEKLAINALVLGVLASLLSVTGFYYYLN